MGKGTVEAGSYKYRKLYGFLMEKISLGKWMPGDRLPTERELSETTSCSRITVRKTLRMLEQEGYIYRRQGKGTFVAFRPIKRDLAKLYTIREDLAAQGICSRCENLSIHKTKASGVVMERLQIPKNSEVFELFRCFTADGKPYAVETSRIPVYAFPGLTGDQVQANGLYNTMRELGRSPERAEERLTACPAGRENAKILSISSKDTVIRIERTTFSGAMAVEYTVTYVKSDYFTCYIELG